MRSKTILSKEKVKTFLNIVATSQWSKKKKRDHGVSNRTMDSYTRSWGTIYYIGHLGDHKNLTISWVLRNFEENWFRL